MHVISEIWHAHFWRYSRFGKQHAAVQKRNYNSKQNMQLQWSETSGAFTLHETIAPV
jgi:hypothetical protein